MAFFFFFFNHPSDRNLGSCGGLDEDPQKICPLFNLQNLGSLPYLGKEYFANAIKLRILR